MTVILIPSYEPNQKLIALVTQLKKVVNEIVIVDDGSQQQYQSIFHAIEAMHVKVYRHQYNQGKGAALKTGIKKIIEVYPQVSSILTCDSDGQHHEEDILKLYEMTLKDPKPFYLGVRNFKEKGVPFKSRFGNTFSSLYFFLSTLTWCPDTQTGLRAIPEALYKEAMNVKENRFDYEMVFLTQSARKKHPTIYVPIRTIYENNNEHSHFRPVVDAFKIYKKPMIYGFVGLSSAVIDVLLFTLFIMLFSETILSAVALSTILARLVSGIYNFLMNKYVSFNKQGTIKKHALKYGVVYIIQLLLSVTFVFIIGQLITPLSVVKIFVDGTLFIISYIVQKKWVFK